MNDKAVEKIASAIDYYSHRLAQLREEQYQNFGSPEWMDISQVNNQAKTEAAHQAIKAILSDPDIPIIEYEPDAEIPKIYDAYHHINFNVTSWCASVYKEAGWKKEKK